MAMQLRDIHMPTSDFLWWPLAPGWYACIVLLSLSLAVWLYIKKRKAKKPQVQAHVALEALYQHFCQNQDQHQFMQALSILIRRICLRYFTAEDFAALQGQAWLRWLDQTTDGKICFSEGIGCSLQAGPYDRQQHVDVQALYQLCQQWLSLLEKKRC